MIWLDYREQLGIGFNDIDKGNFFINTMMTVLKSAPFSVSSIEYINFCMETGIEAEISNPISNYKQDVIIDLQFHSKDGVLDFLSYCVALINCLENNEYNEGLIKILETRLEAAGIQYDLIKDEDGIFVFPKGVPEMDKALVTDTLLWLHDYPNAEQAWEKALKSYANVDDESASNVADNFRKALECFFREFFDSKKSLDNMMSYYGEFLKSHDVPNEIINDLKKLLNLYTDYNNHYAKHADESNTNVLEYIMYQTGNIIRLLITLKNENMDETTEE